MSRDTIFALSSGQPPAAIAVVRVSGPQAQAALELLAGMMPEPRTMVLRTLRDPDTGELLDRGLVAFFPAATSVTGEDLAELHLHGGRAVVRGVEDALERMPGHRHARAGEFTWRAFENGKINLIQVEALSDLLRAETEAQRKAAVAGNAFSAKVEQWRRDLLLLSALVEASIDHSDEDDVRPAEVEIAQRARSLHDDMAEWLSRPSAERLFEGLRVAIAGPPNAGKSTLLNALAGRDAAITSDIAGTTRDVIEVPVAIGGVAFVLVDMAGLREDSADRIELIGIERARDELVRADLTLWLGDEPPPDNMIRVHARADLPGREETPADAIAVSATTGSGLNDLISLMLERARMLLPHEGEAALTRRQRDYVSRCANLLHTLVGESDELIRAELLRQVRAELDALTGRAGTEELLDALFGTFCIGK